ncbi:MAG: hypothetical protein LiPW41_811 [Parcubacteria group bacterium LiPW_41]|nr:MAG: hypothetical protein LiPW41_811 [Parcubacteria group bacterium LiPW_41]
MKNKKSGFSLLELLLTIAVIAVIGAIGSGFYIQFSRGIELDETAKAIVADLKLARENALAGKNQMKWGIRFTNASQDYYELFSTPTVYGGVSSTIVSTTYLNSVISFDTPTSSTSLDVVFSKISGNTTSTSIVLRRDTLTKSINVATSGLIYQ